MFRPGTHVPVIDYAVPAPVESQYNTINIVGQYDIFSDPPNHFGNLLADLNTISAAGFYGHSATAFSDPARVTPSDIMTATNSRGATTTTYLIRTDELPLVRALVDMAGLPPEAAEPLNAVLKPMIDRAYDPGPEPGLNLGQFATGAHHLPDIAPAISIPIESTNAGITAGTTALTAANVARTAVSLVGGAQGALPSALPSASPVKGGKGPLSTIRALTPKGKK